MVGANHRSASVGLRERLFVDEAASGPALRELRAEGIAQAFVISTCDRVEVAAIHDDAAAVADAVIRVLAARAGIDPAELSASIFTLEGEAAARHLFAVAASLESLVIGEPHVLGQVKDSHRLARAADMVGDELERLLQAAYGAAKRVRTETRIGERPVSIAAGSVDVAREIHGDLSARTGLMIGVGEMGAMVAEQLVDAGLGRLAVTHRATERAAAMARHLGANVQPWDALADALAAADVVVACVGLGTYVVTREAMRETLRRRRLRPQFVIDLAVPPDVDPAVGDLDGAFVYDAADLEGVARAGLAERQAAAQAAWRLIDEELAGYMRARMARTATPAVVALRAHFEAVRDAVLAESGADDPVNRLLHEPGVALRDIAAADDLDGAEILLHRLFRLGGADGESNEEDPK
jgi:glutamyl-tRNA reductase